MSALRQEIQNYVSMMSEEKLAAIKPVLAILVSEPDFAIEIDLTEKERDIIAKGRKIPDTEFITLDEALKIIRS